MKERERDRQRDRERDRDRKGVIERNLKSTSVPRKDSLFPSQPPFRACSLPLHFPHSRRCWGKIERHTRPVYLDIGGGIDFGDVPLLVPATPRGLFPVMVPLGHAGQAASGP